MATDPPFWRFSLAVYARPGVPEACLSLQDRRGQDVNLLLLMAWAGAGCAVRLEAAEAARIAAAIAPWHREVVAPLRAVRRRLKGDAGAETLRAGVKALELEAERLEQERLSALSGLQEAEGGGAALALANLCLLVPGDDAEDLAALRALAEAAAAV